MKILVYFIPLAFVIVFVLCFVKKINIYDTFVSGVKKSLPLMYSLFPYLVAIFILTELFSASGLSNNLTQFLTPLFNLLSIPTEIAPLVIIKPFSGSGSLALLSDIFTKYGVDSYIARSACAVYGSSETIFYLSAIYFASTKNKKIFLPVLLSLIASFCSCIFACFICKIL